MFLRGKVKNHSQRIEELKKIRDSNQSAFAKNEKLRGELYNIEKSQENYTKSTVRAAHLDKIGLTNTPQNNTKIFKHFLDVGQKVTKNDLKQISYIEGPNGRLKVESQWSIHPNGKAYLSSAFFKPVSK